MRVSSPITPFFTGTFMSTRISTRLPARDCSVSFLNCMVNFLQSAARPGKRWRGGRRVGSGAAYLALNIALAVRSICWQKPHSLSYQASTLTMLPLLTLVRVASKVEPSVLWLKSDDTSGRVL